MMSLIKPENLRDQMATWVNKFEWQIFMTGTFQPERSTKDTIRTKKRFKSFLGDLSEKFGKNNIEYFLAVERFRLSDETHCHALLNGLDGLTYRQIGEIWRERFGREEVEKYDPTKGANYYLTKYVTKELCDWDLNVDLRKAAVLKF
jgi:hypothetical protein